MNGLESVLHRIAYIQARFLPTASSVKTPQHSEFARVWQQTWEAQSPAREYGSGAAVREMIVRTARELGVDPRLAQAVAQVESGLDQKAVSAVGAVGVMQLMPETAAALGVDPTEIHENIRGGVQYLKQLLDRYHGNVLYALAAYNAGPGAVDRYSGVPPYRETQQYVNRVLSLYQQGE